MEQGEQMSKKKKKKNPAHYVDNEDFYAALCVWKDGVVEADECGEQRPPIPDYIGECFLKMAEGLSRRACFINYDFREEMIGDAIENCILYAHNFKKEGKNPFAYFTQMMYYAFLRRIQKEKKQMYIKYKLVEQSDEFRNFPRWDDRDPHEKLSLGKSFGVTENDIEKFSPKKKKKIAKKKKTAIKNKNKGGSTLDGLV
tara:strand:+ start:1272 stop:1868 length:597 start_codon:yes stop_codon:yes gene_type:complete